MGYIHSNHVVCETLTDSSARNVFFSFLIISEVGYIHSNHAVREILTDSSVFFNFENIYLVQDCSSNLFSSLSSDKKGKTYMFIKFSKILARNKPVTLILTPHCPQRRKIQYIY